jgi:hypothetical protein
MAESHGLGEFQTDIHAAAAADAVESDMEVVEL